jgi:hypothetical protein
MDVKEQERLSNFTLGHEFKLRNNDFNAVLHLTVTVGSSIILQQYRFIKNDRKH